MLHGKLIHPHKVVPIAILAIFVLSLLSGCATTRKHWQLVDGSKSDGVVELSFQYGVFEKVEIDNGNHTAARRCRGWGYSGAESFGGEYRECNSYSTDGSCWGYKVTKKYQCLE